jgi:hypothetical protein
VSLICNCLGSEGLDIIQENRIEIYLLIITERSVHGLFKELHITNYMGAVKVAFPILAILVK